MIKIHKLEDGDIIKILPMIDNNDKISWIKKYDCVGLGTGIVINDTSEKGYLRRISQKIKESNSSIRLPLPFTIRYSMNIYIGGEIRILNVSRTLFEIIKNDRNLLDIGGNHQLFVVKKEVNIGAGQIFPDWKGSYVSEKSWTPPVNDINSQDEWFSYIKSNQPDFDKHLEKSNIFNHKQALIDYLGKDMLSELISDDRQNKLNEIGI
jgi:hypothetical protein